MLAFNVLAGLPRSGSTLLSNILAQNPALHVSPTSPVLDLTLAVRQQWGNLEETRSNPDEERKLGAMRGVVEGFYHDAADKVVIDKGRGWPQYFELLKLMHPTAKAVITVRDIRDILASMELIWRKLALYQGAYTTAENIKCANMLGRVDYNLQPDQPLGLALNRVQDAYARGHGDMMLFVDYDKLVADPERELRRIYNFLDLGWFDHDLDKIEQTIHEDDTAYRSPGLHTIREKIDKSATSWQDIFGGAVADLGQYNFWSKLC